ncbi:MAG: DUF1501 domain-containing protein [Flavobacteriales bacterium]|nr:DUF1501 domain-containing protein [Flavobacteriales bacterium]
MKRRSFIKRTAPVTVLPVLINGMSFKSYANSPLLRLLGAKAELNDKVLVLVQLNGGNDGLNTVIPLDQYTNLTAARPNLILDENKVLKLKGFDQTCLHPSMTGLQNLFNNESSLNILQAVGYPSPNFSHFRATDIWATAPIASNQYVTSGWAGRYLDDSYPGFPNGYPNSEHPDPLALSIGGIVSQTFQGPSYNMGMAISDPNNFYNFVDNVSTTVPDTPAGKELAYLRLVAQQTDQYAEKIKDSYNSVKTLSTMYPASGNSLANQLKIVARLIAGGLKTKIYLVSLGGFDTHSNQVNATGGTETGAHANLWENVSVGISAFMDDCHKLGISDKVAGLVYSEFGRRIASNASLGTDHGAGGPCMVFGTQVNNTILGTNPSIPSTVNAADNVPMQNDFRAIYSSILQQWFGLTKAEAAGVLLATYNTLPIFKTTGSVEKLNDSDLMVLENYPNPFHSTTSIRFKTNGGYTQLKVYDAIGNEVKTLVDKNLGAGSHTVSFDASSFPSGNYYYHLINGNKHLNKVMVKN